MANLYWKLPDDLSDEATQDLVASNSVFMRRAFRALPTISKLLIRLFLGKNGRDVFQAWERSTGWYLDRNKTRYPEPNRRSKV